MRRAFFLQFLLPLLGPCRGVLLAQTQDPNVLPPLPMPNAPGAPAGGGLGGVAPGPMGQFPGGQAAGQLKDIAPPVDIPFWTPLSITLAVLAGLVLLGLLVFGLRRWFKRARPLPPPPDPVQTALKALDKLAGAAGEALSPKEFAAAVAGVIRRFLESKHGLEAPRQTTEEFLESIERSNRFVLPVREQMRVFLGLCDELKFSRVDASDETRKELLKSAFKLVQEDLV
jgi:hypothetical protein